MSMNKYLERAQELFPHLQELQQTIHQYGGVGFDFRPSADLIIKELKDIGLEPQEICECGIVATVGKKPGRTEITSSHAQSRTHLPWLYRPVFPSIFTLQTPSQSALTPE